MHGRIIISSVAIAVLLSLTACGSPLCGPNEPSSKGTVSSGPVQIATDRSVYAPSDTIHITVTNNLDKTIYLVSRLGQGCPLIGLVKEENEGQMAMNSCHPGGEAPPTMASVSLAPRANATFILTKAQLDQPFVGGHYHVTTRYVTFRPGLDMEHADIAALDVASASIRICDCARC